MANIISIINSISSLRPGSQFTIRNGGVLEWLDTEQTEPTQAEIDAELIRLEAEFNAQEYARNRKAEYDALNQFEMQFDDEENGTTTWKDAVNAIKTKYPKPE
tara:strand:- start:2185 stop:2493 length:309 start_codon:yes stop_codon:yes gene_type:complete